MITFIFSQVYSRMVENLVTNLRINLAIWNYRGYKEGTVTISIVCNQSLEDTDVMLEEKMLQVT